MLFPLSFWIFILWHVCCYYYTRNMTDTIKILTFLLFDECWNLYFVEEYYYFSKILIYAGPLLVCIKYLASSWFACSVSPSFICYQCCIDHLLCMVGVFRLSGTTDYCHFCYHWRQNFAIGTEVLIFELMFLYRTGTCFRAMVTTWTFQYNMKSTKWSLDTIWIGGGPVNRLTTPVGCL